MKTWSIKAGSVAERVVEYLREHGETATSPLAEAVETASTGLRSCVELAIRNGAIATEKRGGIVFWRLGDGKAIEREKDEPLQASHAKTLAKPLTDGVDIDKVLHGGRVMTMREIMDAEDGGPDQGPPAPFECMRMPHALFACAIFNDGRLVLEFDGIATLELAIAQTRELCRYLDRIAEPAA